MKQLFSRLKLFSISTFMLYFASSCNNAEGGTGTTGSVFATLTMKVDGRTYTTNKAQGTYYEMTQDGVTLRTVGFSSPSQTSDDLISLSALSSTEPVIGTDITFGKGLASPLSAQAFYRKPNTANTEMYLVSPLSSTNKVRFTYKVIRIFDNRAVGGKSVEFDFSGVLYKSATDSVVITNGTLRY
jgi:hypothetical protein